MSVVSLRGGKEATKEGSSMCAQRREVPELLYKEELPELELLEQKARTALLRKGKSYLASGSHCMFALEGSRVVIYIVKRDESQAAKSSFFFFF